MAKGDREGAVEAFRSALGLLDPTGRHPPGVVSGYGLDGELARIGEAS